MSINVCIVSASVAENQVCQTLETRLTALGVTATRVVYAYHKDPAFVGTIANDATVDLFVVAAGLNAQLPGIMAAHTTKPVIAVPCHDVMQGLDAVMASMQMPRGFPVLTCGVEQIETVVQVFQQLQAVSGLPKMVQIYGSGLSRGRMNQLIDVLEPYGLNVELTRTNPPESDWAVYFVDLCNPDATPIKARHAICVPYVSDDTTLWDPRVLLTLTAQGGLWVGLENIRNAAWGMLMLWDQQGRWQESLQQVRGQHNEERSPAHV